MTTERAGITTANKVGDDVDHPVHYNVHPSGIECIEVARHHNFNIGSAIKYLWRQNLKEGEPSLKDLKKAAWYLADEIARIEREEDARRQAEGVCLIVSVGYEVNLGKKEEFIVEVTPQVTMSPTRIVSNVPVMGMVTIKRLSIGDENVLHGTHFDAHLFNPTAHWDEIHCSTASPTAPIELVCTYTGKVPKGYKKGKPFGFTVNLIGPAKKENAT